MISPRHIFGILFIAALVNCNNEGIRSSQMADSELAVKVEGMVCAIGCATLIEREMKKIPGVVSCKVDYSRGLAEISYSSKRQSSGTIVEKIGQLNGGQYKVLGVQVKRSGKENESILHNESDKENSESEVAFHFPELITYFMNRLIR